MLSATGGATFLNTVAAGGNITGNNLSGTNTGDNTTATALTGVPAIAVNTISATGLITCDDITAAADTRITPSVDASDVGGFHFTPGGITEAASGTHPLIAGMTVAPFAVTATGSTVTTIAANVHIDGVPTGAATTGYSLWCGGADGTVDGRIGGAIISGGTF